MRSLKKRGPHVLDDLMTSYFSLHSSSTGHASKRIRLNNVKNRAIATAEVMLSRISITAARCVAWRCVTREIETLSASLYISPRNAKRSRNGNKSLRVAVDYGRNAPLYCLKH